VRVPFRQLWLVLDSTARSHWFYEDFVREANPQFPSLPLKKFSQIFFRACPVLRRWSSDFEIAFNNFMQYKTRVPVCGAIMLNDSWEKVRRPWFRLTRPVLTPPPSAFLSKAGNRQLAGGSPRGKSTRMKNPTSAPSERYTSWNVSVAWIR